MELFILAYRRNEKLCYTKKPYTLFEKIFFVSVLIMTAFIFFAVILQNIYGSNIYGCIAFAICAVWIAVLLAINKIKNNKLHKAEVIIEHNENNIKILKSTFEERKITWSKESLNLLLRECDYFLGYKNKDYEIVKNIISVVFIPMLIAFVVSLFDIFSEIDPLASLGIYILGFIVLGCLFMIYPIVESLVYKNTYYYQKIKTTILDYMLTKEYETMD